jgi:hypothetical protein
MSIETIGTGLKTRLDTITGLRVYAPNELPSAVNDLPAALILPGPVNYHGDFASDYDYILRVVILLASQDQPSAFNKILDYIEPSGTYSVLAAIEGDKTLSATCDTLRVIRNLGITTTTWAGISYLSTEFEVAIYA